jgi:2-polyprenyl-3-methyl-5-hydroxy-6-metoxy-1,4-benzoquinol methylase
MLATISTPACPVCDSADTRRLHGDLQSVYSRKRYDIFGCSKCTHKFTHPAPDPSDLDEIYGERYAYEAHSLILREKLVRARRDAAYLANLPGVNSVLEVGCMYGFLLEELARLGKKARGVELNADAVSVCRSKGLDVDNCSLEDYTARSHEEFDAVVMSHLLEHISRPSEQLEQLRGLLRDHGMLVINVPNADARTCRLFGRYWGWWQVPVHVHHFTEASLTRMLEKQGFRVKEVGHYGADSLLYMLSAANLCGLKSRRPTLPRSSRWIIKSFSTLVGPWARFGDEELRVVAEAV